MNETFNLHGGWFLSFQGKVAGPWNGKGPAETALSLLESGHGQITELGVIKWRVE